MIFSQKLVAYTSIRKKNIYEAYMKSFIFGNNIALKNIMVF